MMAVGAVLNGRYELVQLLGQGGFGEVYLAYDHNLGRKPVAIKVLHGAALRNPTVRARLLEEATTAARLGGRHVVNVTDAGDDPHAGPFLVMEYLQGSTLEEHLLRRGGRLGAHELSAIFTELQRGLGHAHSRGVVHRDLKPANVFLAQEAEGAIVVKILDFGLAKVLAEGESAELSRVGGTAAYMAPEQATSRSRIGPETDVWALGLMAFHLLTGRHYWYAFNHDAQPTPMEVGVEVLTAPLESASARAVSLGVGGLLPPGFDAWFARCVARDRGARFRDATECITALREALVGRAAQPPTARTTPAAPRLPGPMPMQTGAGFASFEVPVSFVAPGPVAPHNVRSQPTPSTRHDPWAGAATSGRTEAPTHSSGKSADGARDVSKQHSRLSIATMTMITALALSASGYWGWNQLQSARLSNAGESALNTNSPTTYPTTRLEAATPSYARSEQARPVVLLHPDTTRASSFIQLREGSFPPSLAFDSDPNTAWNEAAPGHGRGEWIEAGFNRPVVVRSVEFATGWNATSSRGTDLFHGNARLRRVRISFSSGRFIDRETGSEERVHRVVSLSERTTTVRITAMEVWPGTRWEDLAISDISIRGTHD